MTFETWLRPGPSWMHEPDLEVPNVTLRYLGPEAGPDEGAAVYEIPGYRRATVVGWRVRVEDLKRGTVETHDFSKWPPKLDVDAWALRDLVEYWIPSRQSTDETLELLEIEHLED